MTQITNEELYTTAFYYVVGVLSTTPYYENIDPNQIAVDMLKRAGDVLIAQKNFYEQD